MKIKIITDLEELEQFTSREDITISKIDVRSCEQSFFAQQWFVAVVMYKENTGDNFDWQSFRAEAAKNILCAIINRESSFTRNGEVVVSHKDFIEMAIEDADALIIKLKEKEEK